MNRQTFLYVIDRKSEECTNWN